MPGLLRGVARTAAIAGTATAVSNRVSRRQANRWSQQEQQQPQAYEQPPPPVQQAAPPAEDMDAKIAQIRQLGELKEQGLLTEAEFQTKKSQILGL